MALGAFCFVLNSAALFAECDNNSISLGYDTHVCATPVALGKACPAGYHPSEYLNRMHGSHCYKCMEGTEWSKTAHTCT